MFLFQFLTFAFQILCYTVELLFISAAQGERKISFVLHEPDNESEESSNNTVNCQVSYVLKIRIIREFFFFF